MSSLGIIAGSGRFPFLVAEGARQSGRRVVVCGLEGNASPALADSADIFTMLNIGKFGTMIKFFKKHNVRELCMAGAVNKPKAMEVRPDLRAAGMLLRLLRTKGDDALLRAVAEELTAEGFMLVRPDALVPSLRGPAGVLSRRAPDVEIQADIRFGMETAQLIGSLDIGQCIVVRSGIVAAVEALEGTDATLERGGSLGGPGCTMIKIVKPGQDERLDLPSIGLHTVELLIKHDFACLAYQAHKTLFFDRDKAIAAADAAGLVIVGVEEDFGGLRPPSPLPGE